MPVHRRFLARALLALLALAPLAAAAADPQASGVFLVAAPQLTDPNFRETVVLVTHPRGGVPFGVIVNRPLERRLADTLPEYESLRGRKDIVYFGGPVAPAGLVFVVRSETPFAGATAVLKDVYVLSDPDAVQAVIRRPESVRALRVYAGYAGWGPGQLQHEIERGDWHVVPADAATIFEKDAAAIWPELIARAAARRTRSVVRER